MVVAVDFVDELAIEIDDSFELFSDQAAHAFVDFVFLLLFDEFLGLIDVLGEGLWGFGAHSEIGVDGHVGVDFEHWVCLLASLAAVFTPADFLDVGAFPGGFLLHFFNDVFLVDEHKAVETELLLTGGRQVVLVTLINDFIPELAHVANTHSHKGNGRRFVERQLLNFSGYLLFHLRLLLLGWLIYWRILLCHFTISITMEPIFPSNFYYPHEDQLYFTQIHSFFNTHTFFHLYSNFVLLINLHIYTKILSVSLPLFPLFRFFSHKEWLTFLLPFAFLTIPRTSMFRLT